MQNEKDESLNVLVRRASRDDYDAFRRLFPELRVADPVPGIEAWASLVLPSTWVAARDSEVVGYCYLQEYLETGYIRNVVVAPAARRKGVGRALMASAAEYLRARGKQSWRLNVRPSNEAALALYVGLGMRVEYLAKVLRFPWAALAALPAGNAVVESLQPARDAVVERQFDLPRGQLAAARSAQRLVFEARAGAESDSIGVTAFEPKVPSAFPFRVSELDAVAPLLRALRSHAPLAEHVHLVAENDDRLASLLTTAGASLSDEIVHLSGVL